MRRRHVEGEPEPPTKSELKRRAQALQQLGDRLIAAPEALLDSLHLPEKLDDAIHLARRIHSRAALARQKQYVGKLMRQVDPAPILEALQAQEAERSLAARRFHRVERWRDRLVAEGEPALEELASELPEAGNEDFRRLVAPAREPADQSTRARTRKQLFRALERMLGAD